MAEVDPRPKLARLKQSMGRLFLEPVISLPWCGHLQKLLLTTTFASFSQSAQTQLLTLDFQKCMKLEFITKKIL